MNSVALVGRLTRDPELRRSEGEERRSVCELRLAVSNGDEKAPMYIDVATFGRQAEACARYLARGREVAVEGRLVHREWKAQDGSKRSKHSVTGRVQFLGSGNGSRPAQERESAPEPAADEPGF